MLLRLGAQKEKQVLYMLNVSSALAVLSLKSPRVRWLALELRGGKKNKARKCQRLGNHPSGHCSTMREQKNPRLKL